MVVLVLRRGDNISMSNWLRYSTVERKTGKL
jgi:hypothetical protein